MILFFREGDFSICRLRFPEIISIFGFLKLSDVSSPPFISRHLILPKTESGLYCRYKYNVFIVDYNINDN